MISTLHDTDPDDRCDNVFVVTAEMGVVAVEQKVISSDDDVDNDVDDVVEVCPPPPETFYDGCPVSQIDWSKH